MLVSASVSRFSPRVQQSNQTIPSNSFEVARMKAVLSLVVLLRPGIALAGTKEKPSPIGKKIEVFKLHDYRGGERSFTEFTNGKVTVVAFFGTACPVARLYGARLAGL